ncbi:MAG TPA: hypothetical protein ENK85_10380 [Saprospiraceae bacterium]|nr:hypothetical protein [Saprospiraceae bacterium]
MRIFQLLLLVSIALVSLWGVSCKHDPIIENVSTNPQDTIHNSGTPCEPGIVYYFRDVQPILMSNCAVSGCHDASTHKEGINYSSFSTTLSTGKVKPNQPNQSKMYKVLFESGEEKMPPNPRPSLTNDQKAIIKKWINQGAKEYFCDANVGCDSVNVSYANDIVPILSNSCTGCHSGNTPSGNVSLDAYQSVATFANNGKLYGTAAHLNGYSPMPPSGNGITDCAKAKIKNWVEQGAPDN